MKGEILFGIDLQRQHGDIVRLFRAGRKTLDLLNNGVDKGFRTILIGAGNLGRAIAAHINFSTRGCELVGIFDIDRSLTGEKAGELSIMHTDELEKFCRQKKPMVAVLCIPKANTQEIADRLVALGIKAFWNFSHYDLSIDHDDIVVENVHLGDSLMTLTYRAKAAEEAARDQD